MSKRSPRIGLTTYREAAHWGDWTQPADLLPAAYADAVAAAGGVPLLLATPDRLREVSDAITTVLGVLDGVVVTGGPDLEPAHYGAPRHERTDPARRTRDRYELDLIRAAYAHGVPVLGICRGMQVLNVALGGDLIQHLPERVGHTAHSPAPGRFGTQQVRVEPGSRLARMRRAGRADAPFAVSCHHHQVVDRLGAGVRAVAWAADGTVEALEGTDRRWLVGVQWHPEVGADGDLFTGFVGACAAAEPG